MKSIFTQFKSHGHYTIKIMYRGKEYKATTYNMLAIDAYCSNQKVFGITPIQASVMLWNEVKRANNLI